MGPRTNNPAPPWQNGALPGTAQPQLGQDPTGAISMKWSAIHDAAAAVSALAGVSDEEMQLEVRDFPAAIRHAEGWRREAAEQGIEDLSAILEAGLSALLSAHARGANPTAPALALWREFRAARDALLALVPPDAG